LTGRGGCADASRRFLVESLARSGGSTNAQQKHFDLFICCETPQKIIKNHLQVLRMNMCCN
jgi:hypothetical protein